MIVNLVLGVVFCVVVFVFLRRLRGQRDASPRHMLRQELARRRAIGETAVGMPERLRDVARERLRPVAAALAEMRDELPEGQRFELRDEGHRLTVRVGGRVSDRADDRAGGRVDDRAEGRVIVITHNALTLVLGEEGGQAGATRPLRDERYGIDVDGAFEEHPDLASTVRRLASLVADAVAEAVPDTRPRD